MQVSCNLIITGAEDVMAGLENVLPFNFTNSVSLSSEDERLKALHRLGLLEAESVPVFEEATQTSAHFLDIPICVLGLLDQTHEWFKSAIGLSRLGLMNELATSRQIPNAQSLCRYIVETQKTLMISDTALDERFADSVLVKQYQIRAYLGVPLLDSNRRCLGTLAVMDLVPHHFSERDIALLELTARWSMSEFERNYLAKMRQKPIAGFSESSSSLEHSDTPASDRRMMLPRSPKIQPKQPTNNHVGHRVDLIRTGLLAQMSLELRTPLTSIMGMASVLNQEVYGSLMPKQKEYLGIVHQSGQYLLSLVNELIELTELTEENLPLQLSSVDIEMLSQQAINILEQAAVRREQEIRLSIEPGNRIWVLDKVKVRHLLYHLISAVMQMATGASIIQVHVSRKPDRLQVAVWVDHPWLGDGMQPFELYTDSCVDIDEVKYSSSQQDNNTHDLTLSNPLGFSPVPGLIVTEADLELLTPAAHCDMQVRLGLMLSRQLAELHGGEIFVQGSISSGCRYVVSLPYLTIKK